MDSYDWLPQKEIVPKGEISNKFLALGIHTFKDACYYVHGLEYGYNSDQDDRWILFKELKGSCTSKHGVIAGLAGEMDIPLYKNVGIYKFTESICTGAAEIVKNWGVPYVPMVHCFLVYGKYRFDLTEGNFNGKNTSIEEFIETTQVALFSEIEITARDDWEGKDEIELEFGE